MMKLINPFQKTYSEQDKSIFHFLKQNLLFESLSDQELSEFLPFMHLRYYVKNEIIFFRGDPSQALYLIKKGEVALNIDIEDKFEQLITLNMTDSFGDNAILISTNRIYNAVTISDHCDLYVIPSMNMNEIFQDHIEIKAKIMSAMASYYNNYTNNLFSAYKKNFGFFDLGMIFNNKKYH